MSVSLVALESGQAWIMVAGRRAAGPSGHVMATMDTLLQSCCPFGRRRRQRRRAWDRLADENPVGPQRIGTPVSRPTAEAAKRCEDSPSASSSPRQARGPAPGVIRLPWNSGVSRRSISTRRAPSSDSPAGCRMRARLIPRQHADIDARFGQAAQETPHSSGQSRQTGLRHSRRENSRGRRMTAGLDAGRRTADRAGRPGPSRHRRQRVTGSCTGRCRSAAARHAGSSRQPASRGSTPGAGCRAGISAGSGGDAGRAGWRAGPAPARAR
jgi:hypothetical protein